MRFIQYDFVIVVRCGIMRCRILFENAFAGTGEWKKENEFLVKTKWIIITIVTIVGRAVTVKNSGCDGVYRHMNDIVRIVPEHTGSCAR